MVGALEPVLDVSELVVEFDGARGARDSVTAVTGVSFTVARGEIVAIVGESGSGKSTTVSAVLGLLPLGGRVTDGSIVVSGVEIVRASERTLRELRGRTIGYVPQDPMSNLNPMLRVGWQVNEAFAAHGEPRRSAAERADRTARALEGAGISDAARRARQYPHQYSGGMRQRALIAIGTAREPDLIVADEPTSALDATVQRRVLDRLERIVRASGSAVVLVTHDLALAAERADRVIVMRHGRIVDQGSPAHILHSSAHPYTRQLVAASSPQRVTARSEPRDAAAAAGTVPTSETVLEVRNLHKTYRLPGRREAHTALEGVSFAVHAGRTLALIGESGSGKTTAAWAALGLTRPDSGDVLHRGEDVFTARGERLAAFRRSVQPIFQDPYLSLDPLFTVRRILDEPVLVVGGIGRRERERRALDLLERVGLPHAVARRHPRELSGGQRQRVAIARALAMNPEIIVCDEPVSALDALVQSQILDLFAELRQQSGLGYLFISHDIGVVRAFADDVLVMEAGRVVERGPVARVLGEPQHPYTRELLDAAPGGRRLDFSQKGDPQ